MSADVKRSPIEVRILIFLLILLSLSVWLKLRSAAPEPFSRSLHGCVSYSSQATETLIPPQLAGEAAQKPSYTLPETPFDVASLPLPQPYTLRWRVGIGVPDQNPLYFRWPAPRPGWYLNWSVNPYGRDWHPGNRLSMQFVPMVRLLGEGLVPEPSQIRTLASRNPGQTWLIGNEPDVRWQDDATPEEYACYYHLAYQAIKEGDPTAKVAIGGVSQVTPLRLAYLDGVWNSYRRQFGREMPVDVWNMHAFVLREEAGSWGVGIPPGFDNISHGLLWDVSEHDNLTLVENQVRLMRRWMQEHGQAEKPLYITEYGILMPPDYGFSPGRVVQFMVDSFDLFRTLRDPELGYSRDDYRLVQRWVWFSTRDYKYPAGNLFDDAGEPLPPMRSMSGYIRAMAAGSQ